VRESSRAHAKYLAHLIDISPLGNDSPTTDNPFWKLKINVSRSDFAGGITFAARMHQKCGGGTGDGPMRLRSGGKWDHPGKLTRNQHTSPRLHPAQGYERGRKSRKPRFVSDNLCVVSMTGVIGVLALPALQNNPFTLFLKECSTHSFRSTLSTSLPCGGQEVKPRKGKPQNHSCLQSLVPYRLTNGAF
jgi:hypothetical protein